MEKPNIAGREIVGWIPTLTDIKREWRWDPGIIGHPCPACGAKANKPCRKPSGKLADQPHAPRLHLSSPN